MIDIHSHILPNIDDGASSISEALTMLKMAVDDGVTTQVLTPHIHQGRFDNTKKNLSEHFLLFKEKVEQENIPIKLLLGAELRIGPNVMNIMTTDQVPWLGQYGNKKTFLLEFPRSEIPFGSDNLVRWVLSKNYLPIIVHPERNKTFLNNPEKLTTFTDLGCPIQITAASLTGKFGADVQQWSETLIINDQVSAIASDCHNLKGRKPDLLAGFEKAKSIIGEEKAKRLVNSTPQKLIQNNIFQ